MRKRGIGGPLDVVAGALADEEGGCAADVAVGVEAGFDGEVEDVARGDFFGWREGWMC